MTRALATGVFTLVAALVAAPTAGHTLDEYVQALRVGVAGQQITLQLDCTAGTHVAAALIARIDADGDGVFSPAEAEAYGRALIADLAVTLDGQARRPRLTRVEVPTAPEIRERQAILRIEATVAAAASPGHHRLTIHNQHLPGFSAYLANALLPDSNVRVVGQTRDERQQTYSLEYETGMQESQSLGWLLSAGAGLAFLVRLRRKTADA